MTCVCTCTHLTEIKNMLHFVFLQASTQLSETIQKVLASASLIDSPLPRPCILQELWVDTVVSLALYSAVHTPGNVGVQDIPPPVHALRASNDFLTIQSHINGELEQSMRSSRDESNRPGPWARANSRRYLLGLRPRATDPFLF